MQISLLVQPVAVVSIGISTLYLYPASMGDVNGFSGIPDDVAALEKFRLLLPLVASLSVPRDFREKREPLPDELVAALSTGELEEIATAYVGTPAFDKVRAGTEAVAAVSRHAGEPAVAYLDRLMKAEAERQRRIFEKLNAL